MPRTLMPMVSLVVVSIGAAQYLLPKPKHLDLGKKDCVWVPTTGRADTVKTGTMSLKCNLTEKMAILLDSAGVGSGGGRASQNLTCAWVPPARTRAGDPPLKCTIAAQITVDSAGVGSGGGLK